PPSGAGGAGKPRQQHGGVGEIELLARRAPEERCDLEAPTTLGVDEGREHRRRIEVGQAEEVDGSVRADQRDRVEVADDAVVADGCVTTRHHVALRTCRVWRAIMSSSSVGITQAAARLAPVLSRGPWPSLAR